MFHKNMVYTKLSSIWCGVLASPRISPTTLYSVEWQATPHSGFGQSDLPIWTDFVGGTFRRRVFFLVRPTEKILTLLDQKIPQIFLGAVNIE